MVSGRETGAIFARARALTVAVILVLGCAFLLLGDHSRPNTAEAAAHPNPDEIRAAFARLPLSFEPNQGQSDSKVQFLARGNGYSLYLTSGEAALAFSGKESAAVEMKLAGANANAQIAGAERLPGHSSYFIGNDPSRWHRNVPQYGRVVYREVYRGVDLAFYGNQGRLEYDFDVAPGADPNQIQLDLNGADQLKIADNGDLVLSKNSRELRFQKPRVYQNSSSGQQSVAGSFILRSDNRVSFKLGDYDRSRALVIDPVLSFATYLGGSAAESCGVIVNASQTNPIANCPAIAVDGSQRVYVAGSTLSSTSFPGGSTLNGGADVFIVRFDPSGSALDYTMFLGGSGTEYPVGIGVDSGLNVYLAGTTDSGNFPTTAGAFQASPVTAGNHAFVTKVDSSGSAVLYSTYLSGTNGNEIVSGMAVDSLGRVYVMGITTSTNTASSAAFPATVGSLQSCPGETTSGTCPTPPASQFFFSKVDPSQNGSLSLPYSTYIGGSTPGNAALKGGAVAVDTKFNVYLAGGTAFTDMPIVNAFQSTLSGGANAWVAKLNAPANNTQQYTPSYETYLGAGNETAYGVATDGTNTFVTGRAGSGITTVPAAVAAGTGFPQAFAGGATDGFVAKLGVPPTTGTTQGSVPLSYFTYLGGGADDAGLSIAADSNQNAYVTGWTDSGNFPHSAVLTPGGPRDAFAARILTTGASTFTGSTGTSSSIVLGGSNTDTGTSVAIDPALNVYVAGDTNSPTGNFPNPSSLPAGGGTDAFVAKLGPSIGLTFTCSGTSCPGTNPAVSPAQVGVGSQVTFDYAIYNLGDPVAGVVFTVNFSSSVAVGTVSGANCPTTSGTTLVCTISGTVGTTATNTTSTHVHIPVTAPANAGSITSSATLSVTGTSFQISSTSQTALVNDFSVSIVQPSSATVIAGGVATYRALVAPLQNPIIPNSSGFPGSVSLSCVLPSSLTGAGCTFTNNPIPDLMHGPQSRTFEITTTARVTTPASLFHSGPTYALWMPIFGAGLLGAGISRKRRMLLAAFFVAVLGIVLLQAGCSSGSSNGSSTTGTPAGTYTVVVNATAGATRSTSVQLTVQ